MHPSRLPHLVRGSCAAVFATLVALVAHLTGGGQVPGWLGVIVPLLLSLMVSVLLSGRRLSFVRLLMSVGVSQALFHLLFVLGSVPAQGPSALPGSSHHDHFSAFTAQPVLAAVPEDHAGIGMWAAHAVSALVTTLGLYFSERIVVATLVVVARVRWWWRKLHHALTPAASEQVAPQMRLWAEPPSASLGRFGQSIPRRGPPAFV